MNAINFIKQHGVDKAREVVEDAPGKATVVSAETYGYFYKYQDSPVWCRVYRRKDGDELSCTWFSPIINPIELSDLKRLIESFDLVEHFGNDIGGAKQLLEFSKGCKTIELSGSVITIDRLKQAIADYQSVYSIPESVRQAILNLEMHL